MFSEAAQARALQEVVTVTDHMKVTPLKVVTRALVLTLLKTTTYQPESHRTPT